MFRSRMFPLIALALSCVIPLPGCRSYHTLPPGAAEKNLIQQHSGVIVLLRLRTVVDGKPREDITLREKDETYSYGFGVDIGRLDPGQSPDLAVKKPDTALISPSAEARRQGWIYYVLPPGNYYLTVYDMDEKRPRWLLAFYCRSRERNRWFTLAPWILRVNQVFV